MKKIIVSGISLRNFKGISHLNVDFSEKTSIFGANATGKTTIFDAFLWCLFGKDSANKADFEIKGLDEKGKAINNIEHSVDVSLMVDGKTIILTRTYSEKWSKKRGSAAKEMTGHTTDYLFNGVPCKEKEYQERIKSIIDENAFRLLTDPRRFNEQTSWQERRKILMDICGDVSDADVIASNKKLQGLTALLNGNNIDDFKKIIASQKKEINDQLEKIPVRIDEATRSMVEIRPDIANVPGMITQFELKKGNLEAQLTDLRNGGALSQKRIELANLDAEIQTKKNVFEAEKSQRKAPLISEVHTLEDAERARTSRLKDLDSEISRKNLRKTELEQEIVTLRAEWNECDAQEVPEYLTQLCPKCGYILNENVISEARAAFLNNKATKLESINATGLAKKAELASEIAILEKLTAERDALTVAGTNPRIAEINKQISDIDAEQPDLLDLYRTRETLLSEARDITEPDKGDIEKVEDAILAVKTDIALLNADLQKVSANDAAKARIAELEAQQADLGKQYEEVEANLFLVESFTRAKAGFLEGRINGKFQLARFKMFEEQINGGINDQLCFTTLKGIPYPSINNAGKIQVGMDIIRTLQAHYGVEGPIFVDNRESIIELPDMDCQVISLIVSEQDKTLRIAA